jgi:hypothetical protein
VEDVASAATEALARLQSGERNLAIHPGCGTNYLVAGAMGGTLAWMSFLGARSSRDRMARLLPAILMATFGFILAQPVGPLVQEHVTTSGDPGNMVIEGHVRDKAALPGDDDTTKRLSLPHERRAHPHTFRLR